MAFGDATVTRTSWDGPSTLLSTFLEGSAGDMAFDVAINSASNLVVVGSTLRRLCRHTKCADDTYDGFQWQTRFNAIINPTETDVLDANYCDVSSQDKIFSIDLDEQDNIYVAGFTATDDSPTTSGAYGTAFNKWAGFKMQLESSLTYSLFQPLA